MRCFYVLVNGLLLLLLISLAAWAPAKRVTKWAVSSNSSLQVHGSTNLNKFACEIKSYNRLDTLQVTINRNSVALTGTLQLDLRTFDCQNPIMTRDLRKTLKADQFPLLGIRFLNLSKMPALCQDPATITGWVDIALAGARQRVEVTYQLSVDAQNVVHLVGTRDVTFADFNLTPPTKFKGMVQTHQKLTITFHLKMKAVG